ncbi:MAG: ABC transporter substrate-binding protein [Gammaproteobacteria bacterium]
MRAPSSRTASAVLASTAPTGVLALLAGAILVIALSPPRVSEASTPGIRKFSDMTGRVAQLRGTPKRVMVFAPVLSHYVTVDGDGHVSAITRSMRAETAVSLLGKLYPTLSSKETASTTTVNSGDPAGVEQTMLEEPDVILTWGRRSGAKFEEIRYPGLLKLFDDGAPAGETTYRFFGELTQQGERVEALLGRDREQLDELYAQLPRPARLHELMVIFPWNYAVWGKTTPAFNRAIRLLGAQNVGLAGVPGGQRNIEEINKLDPEIIFLPTSVINQRSSPADVYADKSLGAIRAVRDRRVYRLPNGAASMEGPVENALLMQWIAELLYPDMKMRVPLRTAIRNAYRSAFAYEMSDDDIDALLRLDENGISANYQRFARVSDR